jgi:hypothetical protein
MVKIVRRFADQVGFQILPGRWAEHPHVCSLAKGSARNDAWKGCGGGVERCLAWINGNRRLGRGFPLCR